MTNWRQMWLLTTGPLIWRTVFFAEFPQWQDGRRVIEYLHRHEEIKIVNVYLCILVSLYLSVVRCHSRRNPSGIDREFSLLWLFRRRSSRNPCNEALSLFFELADTSRQVPCYSAGRIFLGATFRLVSFPQISEHTDCVLEVRTFFVIPCDGPCSFPVFLCGATCPWRILTVWFDPNFPHVEQTISDENLEQHNGNWSFRTTLLWLLAGLFLRLKMSETAIIAIHASCLTLVI